MSASNRWWRNYEQECADHRAYLTVNNLVLVNEGGWFGWRPNYPDTRWEDLSPISGLQTVTYSNGHVKIFLCRSDTNYAPFDNTTVRLV